MSTVELKPEAILQPKHVPAGTGLFLDLGDHRAHGKIASEESGAFLLTEMVADYQGGVPPHTHTREEETFYILEGRFEFTVGGERIEAGPGDTVFAPRNIPHSWRCVSLTPGKALLLITPGANFQAFALKMAELQFDPAAAMTNPDLAAKFCALTEAHGITMHDPSNW